MSIHLPKGVIHMSTPTVPVELVPEEWRDDYPQGCCIGSAMRGWDHCTCWEKVFDLDQSAPVEIVQRADCAERSSSCNDCAYRQDSPERSGDDYVEENLLDLAETGQPFWCHEGMRRVVALVHPDGRRIDLPDETRFHDYDPLQFDGVAYKADGTPAVICGGWAARHEKAAR